MPQEKKRTYKNAPIQEAIVEAKFSYDSYDAALTGQVFEKIKAEYPRKQNLELITLVLGSTDSSAKQAPPPQTPVMQAWKSDNSEVIQIGPGITTVNSLRYSTWRNFLPSINTALKAYVDAANPKYLTRIGVRYINKFFIPDSSVVLSDYFKIGVAMPPEVVDLQGFDLTFIHRVRTSQGTKGADFEIRTKFVTDGLNPGEIGTRFILDIDCYLVSQISPDINQLSAIATEAHDNLEEIFEGFLTNKTRLLIGVEE